MTMPFARYFHEGLRRAPSHCLRIFRVVEALCTDHLVKRHWQTSLRLRGGISSSKYNYVFTFATGSSRNKYRPCGTGGGRSLMRNAKCSPSAYRLDVRYNTKIYIWHILFPLKRKSLKGERERENQPVGRFHPEHSTEMNHKSTRARRPFY